MTPHQEQILRIAIVMFICLFGMYFSMVDVRRIRLLFRENIMYKPTPRRKMVVFAWLCGVLFCAGSFAMVAP